jgi:toxin ParE1/3/4
MGFKLSRAAEDDLIAIYVEGTARFGLAQADAYHDGLRGVFLFLGDHPKAARERPEISPPVRCHPHAAHMIVYTIDADGDAFILRVRHGYEDWEGDPV